MFLWPPIKSNKLEYACYEIELHYQSVSDIAIETKVGSRDVV